MNCPFKEGCKEIRGSCHLNCIRLYNYDRLLKELPESNFEGKLDDNTGMLYLQLEKKPKICYIELANLNASIDIGYRYAKYVIADELCMRTAKVLVIPAYDVVNCRYTNDTVTMKMIEEVDLLWITDIHTITSPTGRDVIMNTSIIREAKRLYTILVAPEEDSLGDRKGNLKFVFEPGLSMIRINKTNVKVL